MVTQVITPPVLDLLVVIDNSGAMEGEQNAFIQEPVIVTCPARTR